jgi:hypothetical protein
MKKSILLIAALALGASSSFAQLSTRENCATNECLGVRPVKGDMALTFGVNIFGLLNSDPDTAGLPLENNLTSGSVLTFKKFIADDVAFRAGIRLGKTSYSFTGTADSASQTAAGLGGDINLTDRERRESDRTYLLVPGIEKHFSNSNIFDVYAGGDLHLGFSRTVDIDNSDFRNGDKNYRTAKTTRTVVGLGGVVGFNIFIAHLPVSLGLEYGWNARWRLGGKTKVETETTSAGVSTSNEFYTQPDDVNGYTDLKRKEFAMDTNQNVRIVLNIFFSGRKAQ